MLWEAAGAALVAAFSPWTLLIVAHLLGQTHPKRLALVFLASAAAVTLAIGFAVVVTLNSTGVDDARRHRTVPAWLDVAVGLAILLFAAVVAHRPPRGRKRGGVRQAARRRHAGRGDRISLPPLPVVPPFDCQRAPGDLAVTLEVLLIAALVLLMAEAPIALFILAPERTGAALKTANGWLAAHGRTIAVTAAGVVGTYFIVNGVRHLP